MKNIEIADIFEDIARLLELKNENVFKIRAYRLAAQNLRSLTHAIEDLAAKNALTEIPAIGKDLAAKIQEYLITGKIKHYEELLKNTPKGLLEIMQIQGMGPKTTQLLYAKFGIDSVRKLEAFAKKGSLTQFFGFKDKTQQNLLKGIQIWRKGRERMLLDVALKRANSVIERLNKTSIIKNISYAGSLRRMKETVRDIDILVSCSQPKKIMDAFSGLDIVHVIKAKGATKSSVVTNDGVQVDLRVVDDDSFGAALLYFTGSKNHNIHLRGIAKKRGLLINEYGLFDENTGKRLASRTEEDLYRVLRMEYIPPEMREDTGEIELAMKKNIPRLVQLKDIKGDLHAHTNWSDGNNSLEEMVESAAKLGYEYIAITDHSQSLKIANGLSVERLRRRIAQIKALNKKLTKLSVLAGTEADIKNDGSIDYPNEILKKLDIVVAAIHTGFKQSKDQLTQRIIKAMQNPFVNIISHPTGRLIGERDAYELDMEAILAAAKKTNTFLEINSHPQRLDLTDVDTRRAKGRLVMVVVNTDAHMSNQFSYMNLGVSVCRRAGLEKSDVLNTYPLESLLGKLKK